MTLLSGVCFVGGFSYLVSGSVIYLVITDKSYPRKMAFAYLDELAKEFDKLYGPKVDSTTRPYAFVGFGQSAARPFLVRPRTDSQPCSPLLQPFADNFMSKTTRQYKDSRSAPPPSANEGGPAGNLSKINEELQDVTRIMTKNMEDLLWRGDSLDRTAPFLLSSSAPLLLAVMLRILHCWLQTGMSDLSTSLRSESLKYRKQARNINLELLIRQYAPFGVVGLFIIVFIWWRFF